MKKSIFIITTLFISNIYCVQITTSDWAHKLGYYKTLETARNKVWSFLSVIDDKVNEKIKRLNDEGHFATADTLSRGYFDTKARWQDQFDGRFEKIDKNLTLKGYELDQHFAPAEQKKELIRESIKMVKHAVEKEIGDTLSQYLRQIE